MSARDSLLFVAAALVVALLIVAGVDALVRRLVPAGGIGLSDLVRQ